MLVVLTPRTPNAKLVLASVRHSQRLSGGLLMPWIVAKTEGTIICGHCTCMAGLGEACSHIAALLFTLENTPGISKILHVRLCLVHGCHLRVRLYRTQR